MRRIIPKFFVFLSLLMFVAYPLLSYAAKEGSFSYHDFKKPTRCAACHKTIYREWKQSMMSQSFTHDWDDVEYYKLALPHAKKLAKVAGVKAGCIACHAPLAFLAGDIPPKPPKAGTRANEGVSCEICHHIVGSTEKEPYNFSFIIKPGNTMNGPRKGVKSPAHKVVYSKFLRSARFCATCHDEKDPYGVWVKETYREWKAGPYAKEGVTCQKCHMYRAKGKPSSIGPVRSNFAHHVFHGSHFANMLKGAVNLALYPKATKVKRGARVKFKAILFNGKVGHYIPSGSTEERMLWLEVWAIDANGHKYAIPVQHKGFKGEKYTIANSHALAYQAIGEIMGIKNFKGLKRDGDVPNGARVFRKPFFDPKGRMTICQWYTANNSLVDYRIGPRQTKVEHYIWKVPRRVKGPVKIVAKLYYSQVPSSVGKFLHLSKHDYEPILVNEASFVVHVK